MLYQASGDIMKTGAAVLAVAQPIQHDEIAGDGCVRTRPRAWWTIGSSELRRRTLDDGKTSDIRLSKWAERINETAMA